METIINIASFATIIYACYVVISIYRMNKGIYDDHREYKRALFADAMRFQEKISKYKILETKDHKNERR